MPGDGSWTTDDQLEDCHAVRAHRATRTDEEETLTRPRGQRGASLIIVMAFMVLLAAIVPALLGLASTGLAVTKPVVADRRELYAATSAVEAAIQLGNIDPDVGVPGGPCPNTSTEVDGFVVDVECRAHPA